MYKRQAVTVTAVPLPSPYGTIEWDATGRVERFVEKPRLSDHWINAGFFVIDRRAFDHWDGDDLERQVLPALAARPASIARKLALVGVGVLATATVLAPWVLSLIHI